MCVWIRRVAALNLTSVLVEGNIVNVIRSSRLSWAGHIVWMDNNELPKKILWTNLGGQRGRGRPKSRWINEAEETQGNWVVEYVYKPTRSTELL